MSCRSLVIVLCLSMLIQLTASQNPTSNGRRDCSEKVDVVFLIDSSLSVRELCPLGTKSPPARNWDVVLNFVSEVVGAMPVDSGAARVGVVTFSTSVSDKDVIPLGQTTPADASTLQRRIRQLPFLGGNTNTTGALRVARAQLAGARRAAMTADGAETSRKQFVVLLTDGANNVDSDPVQEARLLKQDGVRLITVGIDNYVDEAQLKEMASAPAEYSYIHARDFSHLNMFVDQLLSRLICSNPPPAQPCRDSRADIAFVLDASGSIIFKSGANATANYTNWNLMKAFVITLIRSLSVSASQTRIALVRFSHESSIVFYLDSYSTAEEAIEAVTNMTIVASSTNTSSAINVMRTVVFTADNGDRSDVNNVAIVITDGMSDDREATAVEAMAAKDAGVRMFAIGLTSEIDANELKKIASEPLSEHYFNRTSIDLVQTVTSQLLWSVCHDACQPSTTGSSNTCNSSFCETGERVSWTRYRGRLLLGRSYAILTDVSSPAQCQNACLLDRRCRSIQFIASLQQCSISYFSKAHAPDSFRADSEVDYYEIVCIAER